MRPVSYPCTDCHGTPTSAPNSIRVIPMESRKRRISRPIGFTALVLSHPVPGIPLLKPHGRSEFASRNARIITLRMHPSPKRFPGPPGPATRLQGPRSPKTPPALPCALPASPPVATRYPSPRGKTANDGTNGNVATANIAPQGGETRKFLLNLPRTPARQNHYRDSYEQRNKT